MLCRRLASLAILAMSSMSNVWALDALPTRLTLTHTATDTWRADYVMAEPVTAIDFGAAAQVLEFRKKAWRVLTPGVTLVERDGKELASAGGKPFTTLSVEIGTYKPFAQGSYAAINRFSDGGSAFYLGFLQGMVHQDGSGAERDMLPTLTMHGLAGETVLWPTLRTPDLDGYAYFGPAKPGAGLTNLILDPQTPNWLAQVMIETSAKVSQYYTTAFGRTLERPVPILIAVGGFDSSGFSMKGGALGGQVVYRVEGNSLKKDSPAMRDMVRMIVAHEMAHIWQRNVLRGGVGEGEPWIHEGGAESLAIAALEHSGIWSAPQARQHADKLLAECGQLDHAVLSYRGWYACGFQRFHDYPLASPQLWKAMMAATEQSGAVYSSTMIETILAASGSAPAQAIP